MLHRCKVDDLTVAPCTQSFPEPTGYSERGHCSSAHDRAAMRQRADAAAAGVDP